MSVSEEESRQNEEVRNERDGEQQTAQENEERVLNESRDIDNGDREVRPVYGSDMSITNM